MKDMISLLIEMGASNVKREHKCELSFDFGGRTCEIYSDCMLASDVVKCLTDKKIMIPIKYKDLTFEKHFLFPDRIICDMKEFSFVYDKHFKKYLCKTSFSSYNDGQSTYNTKSITVIDIYQDTPKKIKLSDGDKYFLTN